MDSKLTLEDWNYAEKLYEQHLVKRTMTWQQLSDKLGERGLSINPTTGLPKKKVDKWDWRDILKKCERDKTNPKEWGAKL